MRQKGKGNKKLLLLAIIILFIIITTNKYTYKTNMRITIFHHPQTDIQLVLMQWPSLLSKPPSFIVQPDTTW